MAALLGLTIIIVAGLVVAGTIVVTALQNSGKHGRHAHVEAVKALNKAEKALRNIANGAGNPSLEAQIALDEIGAFREKELN